MECNCNKVKYASEALALSDIARIRKKSTREKIPTRAYKCSGGAWHLTSRPDIKTIQQELKELRSKYSQSEKQRLAYKRKLNTINTCYRKLKLRYADLYSKWMAIADGINSYHQQHLKNG